MVFSGNARLKPFPVGSTNKAMVACRPENLRRVRRRSPEPFALENPAESYTAPDSMATLGGIGVPGGTATLTDESPKIGGWRASRRRSRYRIRSKGGSRPSLGVRSVRTRLVERRIRVGRLVQRVGSLATRGFRPSLDRPERFRTTRRDPREMYACWMPATGRRCPDRRVGAALSLDQDWRHRPRSAKEGSTCRKKL